MGNKIKRIGERTVLNPPLYLTYDDVLLLPQHSYIEHRDSIDITVQISDMSFGHPIIPANMKATGTPKMLRALWASNPLFILHRFYSEDVLLNILNEYKYMRPFFVSVGAYTEENIKLVAKIAELGYKEFCVDVAHGDSEHCSQMVFHIRQCIPDAKIIAGNVCTGLGAINLVAAGANIIKAGVGNGSTCSTRIQAAAGAPSLTALEEIRYELDQYYTGIGLIADGGIKNSGDIVKALCFADFVMCGNLFARTSDAEGEVIERDGKQYRKYEGSSTLKNRYIEGVKGLVPSEHKNAMTVLYELLDGVRSGLSYQNCNKLNSFRHTQPWLRFVRQTPNGVRESYPHDVIV